MGMLNSRERKKPGFKTSFKAPSNLPSTLISDYEFALFHN